MVKRVKKGKWAVFGGGGGVGVGMGILSVSVGGVFGGKVGGG